MHRIWDFRELQAGIVWFQKEPDGSARVLRGYVDSGLPLNHYARVAHAHGIDHGSIDYVRRDTKNRNLANMSLFEAMGTMGLNPEVLPAALWRSPAPFANEVAA